MLAFVQAPFSEMQFQNLCRQVRVAFLVIPVWHLAIYVALVVIPAECPEVPVVCRVIPTACPGVPVVFRVIPVVCPAVLVEPVPVVPAVALIRHGAGPPCIGTYFHLIFVVLLRTFRSPVMK